MDRASSARPTKFALMRRNRRTMHVAQLREEAREIGYDETDEYEALVEAAQRELDAMREPCSVAFGRKPKPRRVSLMSRLLLWTVRLGT